MDRKAARKGGLSFDRRAKRARLAIRLNRLESTTPALAMIDLDGIITRRILHAPGSNARGDRVLTQLQTPPELNRSDRVGGTRTTRAHEREALSLDVKAVFLDRDNTLILNDGDLGDPDKVVLREGVAAALRRLREKGFRLVVVTNQGGVARGKYTERDVDAVHQRIARLVDEQAGTSGIIDRFYYCPYHPEGTVAEYRREHPWRKPQPGMLIQAARDLDLELPACWMIGDQVRDVTAGISAGCRTILLSNDDRTIAEAHASFTVSNFDEAVAIILDHEGKSNRSGRPGGSRRAVSNLGAAVAGRVPGQADAARTPTIGIDETEPLRRAIHDLAEEIRTERSRRTEFTPLRMGAGLCQLLVLLFALLALLQTGHFEHFMQWMSGALLLQLGAIMCMLLDART